MSFGRYPYKSALTFGLNAYKMRGSSRFMFLRTATSDIRNNPDMLLNWFFSSDGIGFGILKRWNGVAWVECSNLKVRYF